ncbi:MAG: hypothetical protein ACOC83_05240 [Gemmatimonadota bacterium]
MFLARHRLRVPAALLSGLLLLIGAGEVLGACYCAHRGGDPMEAHGSGHAPAPEAEMDHGEAHDGSASASVPTADSDGEQETKAPADGACRTLCAVACSANAAPESSGVERAADLDSGPDATLDPDEPADPVSITTRPYILPPSLPPPTTA